MEVKSHSWWAGTILRALKIIGSAAVVTFMVVALYQHFKARLVYPPGPDQEEYLAAGAAFVERFVFFWKSPVYGCWLGFFYVLSGKDLETTFYLEKAASVFLLSGLVGFLGSRLFDLRTGVLLGVWVLNCKYLLSEYNNSHTLTGCLFVASALCLLLPNRNARIPASLLLLFLSIKVRAEMWLPGFGVLAYLSVTHLRAQFGQPPFERLKGAWSLRFWVGCGAVVLVLMAVFSLRQGTEHKYGLINEAFAQNYAANYVERYDLSGRFPDPWAAAHEIMNGAMPGANTIVGAIELYPSAVLGHVLYNVRASIKAIPAASMGMDRPGLMVVAVALYLASFAYGKRPVSYLQRWEVLPEETRRLLVVWTLASLLLIVSTYIFRVAARYYIQTIPTQLMLIAFILRAAMNKMRP